MAKLIQPSFDGQCWHNLRLVNAIGSNPAIKQTFQNLYLHIRTFPIERSKCWIFLTRTSSIAKTKFEVFKRKTNLKVEKENEY